MITPLNEDSGMCTSTSGRKIKRTSHFNNYDMGSSESEAKKKRLRRKQQKPQDILVLPSSGDPHESVDLILMTFDALRRRLLQVEECNNLMKRPDLKAGSIMMDYDLRVNAGKIMGKIPGVDIGDIFYFRFELCLIGLHSPSMAGIDYMTTKLDNDNDTLAISIVSSGGYDDESNDPDILVYTGQGGSKANDSTKQVDDQKLERGNLALERSLHRANQVRVIRAIKDPNAQNGKIYYYDGLYNINESWSEKGKSGFNVFKYKLLREPEQPDGLLTWTTTEKWKVNPASRPGVVISDISSGQETYPVCVVNEVDMNEQLDSFSYSTKVSYLRPISLMKTLHSCSCKNVCVPADPCSCAQQNGSDLPYGPTGLLVNKKGLIIECNSMCQCSKNCRNRITQKGLSIRLEIFKTKNRGWGIRSWEPIRAGTFVFEYTGEVIDTINVNYDGKDDNYLFETSHSDAQDGSAAAGDTSFKWNYIPELLGEAPISEDSSETANSFPIVISAKRYGNVSRFMNHSCSPNLFWQPVQHDYGEPHIMFFAIKHIPPMTELTYNYGQSGRKSTPCLCGSHKCRGSFG